MAAAVIPIIATLGPILAQLLPGIIRGVEVLFDGPKQGPKKIEAAVAMAQAAVAQIVKPDGLPGTPPNPTELRAMIEATLAAMQAGGEAKPPASLIDAGSVTKYDLQTTGGGSPFIIEQGWVIRMGGQPK